MKVPMAGGLRHKVDDFRKRFAKKAAILMYHRVLKRDLDPWCLCVSPEHFAEHLEILRTHAHPLGLAQLVQAHKDHSIPDRAVAVTFDDGYADNLYNAKPILEQYGIPATVFVAGGAVGQKRDFWWDELQRIFLEPGVLPEVLEMNLDGRRFHWELGNAAHYSEDAYRNLRGWTFNWEHYPTTRHSLYCTLHQLLQPLPEAGINRAMDQLRGWSGISASPLSADRTLTRDELIRLQQGEFITIGAHTRTHSFLSMLSKSQQQEEILENKTFLERHLGKPVTLFAYPYGCYSRQTRRIVKNANFAGACTIEEECVWHGADRYLLPRKTIVDWDGESFLEQLNRLWT